eukprot:Nitzschia sp. Nitz4//scaffold51_size120721//77295//78290//NITZ4_003736-RA/size120721-processed-gene-0.97-mRNA-1//-1//CDS//3329553889//916//frame0
MESTMMPSRPQHQEEASAATTNNTGNVAGRASQPQSTMIEETALDWWHRSASFQRWKRSQEAAQPPQNPSQAAHKFLQGHSGISYIDHAWRQRWGFDPAFQDLLLVLEGPIAKTWTLRTLAARFVVATRPALFPNADASLTKDNLPNVILLDSTFAFANPQVMYRMVRSTLLKNSAEPLLSEETIQDCLERIHVCHAKDVLMGWIPVLEVLRNALQTSATPTLILWDGFGQEPDIRHSATQWDVFRLLVRLLDACPHVTLILSSRNPLDGRMIGSLSEAKTISSKQRNVTRVQIQKAGSSSKNGVARVQSTWEGGLMQDFAFSMSLDGILS